MKKITIDEAIEELAHDSRETATYFVSWRKVKANGVISRKDTWETKAKSFHIAFDTCQYDCHEFVCAKLRSESDERFEIYKIKRFDKNNNLTGVRRYDFLGCITESWNIDPTKPKASPLKKQIQETRKRLAKSVWWAKRNKKQGEIL